jgi:hypothetical protein
LVFKTLDDQQKQITAISNIIRQAYARLTGQPPETLRMPTPEQLAKQAAEMAELKRSSDSTQIYPMGTEMSALRSHDNVLQLSRLLHKAIARSLSADRALAPRIGRGDNLVPLSQHGRPLEHTQLTNDSQKHGPAITNPFAPDVEIW